MRWTHRFRGKTWTLRRGLLPREVLQMLKGQGRRSKPLLAPLDVDTEAKGAKDDKCAL